MIISLGGGCDVATILDTYGLRTQSLPFDWLWNLDTGLSDVTKIISSDFENLREKNSYVIAPHFQWPDTGTLVFRDYPKIAHIHTNPLENIQQRKTYNRRIDKIIQLLEGQQTKITFIYYRIHHVGEEELSNDVLLDRLTRLFNESNEFMAMITAKYPLVNFSLISLFEAPEELMQTNPLKNYFKELIGQQTRTDIHFEFISPRPETDEVARKQWAKNWLGVLKEYNLISWLDLVLVRLRKIRKKLRRHYAKYSR